MTTSRQIKVLGSGSPILDVLLRVDDAFLESCVSGEKGGMVMIDDAEQHRILKLARKADIPVSRAIGGSAFNTVSGLTHLGVATSFIGKTGEDEDGAFMRKAYEALGGDIRSLKSTGKAATANCICLITPDSQRTMRTNLGASALLTPDDITDADFDGITHLHIEGYQLFNFEVVKKLIALAKKHGCTISYDMASFEVVRILRKQLESILDDIDILFANEDEAAEYFAGEKLSPSAALDRFLAHCRVAVVKVGKEGAWVRESGPEVHVPAEVVEAVDTTGAGDLWQAGFLCKYLQGYGIVNAAELGAATGAAVVQQIGAEIPEEEWQKIRARFHC